MTINAQDAARENVKIYNRTVDSMKEFSANIVRALDVLVRRQQQQFFKQ